MSQSQNAIQEPSMDELLASIREIIEENAGVSPSDAGKQAVENNSSRIIKAEGRAAPRQANNDHGNSAGKQDAHSAARNNNSLPVQDAMNALAERIGLRKPPLSVNNRPEAMVAKPAVSAAQVQPQRVAAAKENKPEAPRVAIRPQPQKQKSSVEMKQEVDESEKGFRADVERSAELLLRPYIAQWLDEHFRQLFERVLREEIQRFIQALRR